MPQKGKKKSYLVASVLALLQPSCDIKVTAAVIAIHSVVVVILTLHILRKRK